jgi:O-acetyl-ADP-ribose deacetylase (regulator of RNase III)
VPPPFARRRTPARGAHRRVSGISCGIFGYPAGDAARIALDTVRAHDHDLDLVRFVLFNDATYDAFAAA